MLTLYIDADACPVRQEALIVAERYGLSVIVATCGNIRVPIDPRIRLVLVEAGSDAVDDWIAGHIGAGDICVTADLPLAARCLDAQALALGPTGRRFTAANIGSALAGRDLSAHLREIGAGGTGPRPLAQKDRSRFQGMLDTMVQEIRRSAGARQPP
jgi:uncharacterized protein YaiI (UPF0178 family)